LPPATDCPCSTRSHHAPNNLLGGLKMNVPMVRNRFY
jgi:hypothetical protein